MTLRINKACGFFPCHEKLEDCTFCYCPYYPCRNLNRGKYIGKNKDIWDCSSCSWIHQKDVVDRILKKISDEIVS